ncbi:MAG: hypothetical protein DRR08_10880 [Candidatus Parabeggiatoa sp. nov. 2]|nr:MAG: hypothetical protein B6247_04075 [Beggiatoa sp. 4572_84]RKZ60619.1 MAG: hypothetical protein DRR08_10880 [Gammaproteobacteria bacterium]HEC85380.1 hypothetical protein [Thioploca sp.]
MLDSNWQETLKVMAKAIAKGWLDDDFKTQLLRNTQKTFEQEGVELPEGVTIEIEEVEEGISTSCWIIKPKSNSLSSNKAVITIQLPPKPADIRHEDLTQWVEGKTAQQPRCLPNCC